MNIIYTISTHYLYNDFFVLAGEPTHVIKGDGVPTRVWMRLQRWKLARAAIALTMGSIDVCNEVIRLIYEVVTEKGLLSMCLAKPMLSVLSPQQSMFPPSHFFFKYKHEWFDGQLLCRRKLKNSDCRWRKALLSTAAALYSKANNSYIGSIYYTLR